VLEDSLYRLRDLFMLSRLHHAFELKLQRPIHPRVHTDHGAARV